jgi:hypothetical protein
MVLAVGWQTTAHGRATAALLVWDQSCQLTICRRRVCPAILQIYLKIGHRPGLNPSSSKTTRKLNRRERKEDFAGHQRLSRQPAAMFTSFFGTTMTFLIVLPA